MRNEIDLMTAQMRFTDEEMARRKKLLGFGPKDIKLLVKCEPCIRKNAGRIVDQFYKMQLSHKEVARIIDKPDILRRLKRAQRAYILALFAGRYDRDYVNNRLRIGFVHKHVGVEPKLYLAAVITLQSLLARAIHENQDAAGAARAVEALEKVIFFDTTLIFDTYIRGLVSEVESTHHALRHYAHELEAKTREFEELSRRDSLTNLYNMRSLYDFLKRDLSLAKRNHQPLSVGFMDIDNFKRINDERGHGGGDEVLRQMARSITANLREGDVACRYGGDEFCVILPNCDAADAEQVLKRISADFTLQAGNVTVSIGIMQTGPESYQDIDDLLNQADVKMYRAKRGAGSKIKT
ncbi:MAG TPA: GGDEF domain-containing protein [Gammaproteobacteria bacterium]|nr:GGDEF domain-containing protein [Gammaproteobacteria bacterium]